LIFKYESIITKIYEFNKVTNTSSNISFVSNFIDQFYQTKIYVKVKSTIRYTFKDQNDS